MATTFDLLSILSEAGISHLHEGRREISGACPKHYERTGRVDTHPSWSISKTTYLHFCHSCGYKGTLTQLLVDVTGAAPVDLELALHEQSFLRQMAEVREQPDEILEPVVPLLTEWSLRNKLDDVPSRLLGLRHLERSAIDAYDVRWSRDTRQWVLPVRNPDGGLMGAQYRQTGSVLTLPDGIEKSTTLFGYSVMSQHDYTVLVESPLDACRLHQIGASAVSSMGAWVSEDQCRLLARAFSTVYLALDDDKAGHTATDFAAPMLRRFGTSVVFWQYDGLTDDQGRKAKDPGDVADDDQLKGAWYRTQRWGL